jgi:alkanesulfonate monooxygenase SsuD/methylene tetrahydromethanopterin reductase-like flavin-dependent oxidoreductase (luciferase family)
MDIAIMVEGQHGLNWPRWQRIAPAVEDLEFAGLYRSEHFTDAAPPSLDALELWTSLTWLADHTRRIAFGPLVSPISFRNPVLTATMAAAVDDLSNGRLQLGLGAGWQQREHEMFGFDLLSVRQRLARFREGVEVVTRLLQSDAPVTFDGAFYQLRDAVLLPRPQRPGDPAIVIGGGKAVLPVAAGYADEWNASFKTAAEFIELSRRLDILLEQQERSVRQPSDVRRSLMTGLVFGQDEAEVRDKVSRRKRTVEELLARGLIVGTGTQIVDQLGRLAEAGVQRVMLQWLDLDDLDGLERLAQSVLPQFS